MRAEAVALYLVVSVDFEGCSSDRWFQPPSDRYIFSVSLLFWGGFDWLYLWTTLVTKSNQVGPIRFHHTIASWRAVRHSAGSVLLSVMLFYE